MEAGRPEPDDISHTFRHRVPVTEPTTHANEGPAVLEFRFFFFVCDDLKKKQKKVCVLTQEVVLQKQGGYKLKGLWYDATTTVFLRQRISLH